MHGGGKLLIQSEQGVDSPIPLPSFFLLLGDAQTLRSLPLADSSSPVCFLSLFSQPCHHSLLSPVTFTSSLLPHSLLLSPSRLSPSLPLSHSLVISLTLHALSTVKADCYQQRHTHTDSPTHTHNNWLLQTMFYSFSLHLFPPSSFSH